MQALAGWLLGVHFGTLKDQLADRGGGGETFQKPCYGLSLDGNGHTG